MGGSCGVRIWWWLLLLLLSLGILWSSAQKNIIPHSAYNINNSLARNRMEMGRRSLGASLNDYSDPSANKGHDPKNKGGGDGGIKIPNGGTPLT
ncbi:hypothetical protein GIB67_014359 [Kingdonia uniflora]|uniref:Uncharacterized protein n=1 Tax=Kingdonia uniflora TaxID=39325 RepID=A0A7J7NTE4_9MAGN|nr:hypothetical protein GIB67_014359 [Kingdonia uniflora]